MNYRKRGILFILLLCIILIGGACTSEGPETSNSPRTAEKPPRTTPMAQVSKNSTPATEDVQVLIRKGNTFMDARRYLDAVKTYTKVLEADPENVDVRIDMGTCYRKMGRPEQAVRAYRKALSHQPDHPNGLANLGVVLAYDLNDLNGAVVVWEKFLSLYPNHQMAASIRQEVQKIKEARGTVPDNKS